MDHSHLGTDFSKILMSFWKQLSITYDNWNLKVRRQMGPYGRVPQNRFWFVPNCEWSIGTKVVALFRTEPKIATKVSLYMYS